MKKGGLFRKGDKKAPPKRQASVRQRDIRPYRPSQPTFSYYSNRLPSDTPRLRSEQTIGATELAGSETQDQPSLFSRMLTWLGLLIFGLLLLKVMTLRADSRVILSAKTTEGSVSRNELEHYRTEANALLDSGFLNKSKLTINTGDIERRMQQKFPELESVVVTVPLVGSRPIVYVLPVPAMVSVETTRGTYSLGSNGRVIAKIAEGRHAGIVLRDLSGVQPEVGQALLPASTMSFIQTVQFQFEKAGMPLESLTLPSSAAFELDAKLTGKGGIIKFNLEEDALQQSGAALGVIRKLGSMPGQYLDVRVPERAYYK